MKTLLIFKLENEKSFPSAAALKFLELPFAITRLTVLRNRALARAKMMSVHNSVNADHLGPTSGIEGMKGVFLASFRHLQYRHCKDELYSFSCFPHRWREK